MTGKLRYTVVVRDPDGAAVALKQGESVPDWASDLVHADDLEGGDPVGGDPDGGSNEPPKEPTNAELEAEIASRNEGRDEADRIVPLSKKKPDLMAALAADDAKQAESGQEPPTGDN